MRSENGTIQYSVGSLCVSAVTHLRTRECTLDDVDLFNSRVIKSSTFEHGIVMNEDNNFNATAIVRTNLL